MNKVQKMLGNLGGALMVVSSAVHTFLGWPAVVDNLQKAKVPQELTAGLAMAWHFDGVAMLVFGLVTLWTMRALSLGRAASTLPLLLIGLAYLAFGIVQIIINNGDPFPLIFAVPGALLTAATWPRAR